MKDQKKNGQTNDRFEIQKLNIPTCTVRKNGIIQQMHVYDVIQLFAEALNKTHPIFQENELLKIANQKHVKDNRAYVEGIIRVTLELSPLESSEFVCNKIFMDRVMNTVMERMVGLKKTK